MSYLLFHITPLYNVKLNMLINNYAIQRMLFKNVKVLRISMLQSLVVQDMPSQRGRPGTQRAVEQETLTSVLIDVLFIVRGLRANWSKD